jgi:hypothetical protein
MISSRNKNQTKEEEKPPEKKNSQFRILFFPSPFPFLFAFFLLPHTRKKKHKQKHAPLSVLRHTASKASLLWGSKQTLTFDLFRRSTKKHKFVRSFVRSFVCVKETTNSERNGDCKI